MKIEIDIRDVDKFGAHLRNIGARITSDGRALDGSFAGLLKEEIQGNIVSLNMVDTGAYLNSWIVRYDGIFSGWRVYSDAKQARRLEYGFFGTDALGRNYKSPARPHVRPAVKAVAPLYAEAYRRLIRNMWSKR